MKRTKKQLALLAKVDAANAQIVARTKAIRRRYRIGGTSLQTLADTYRLPLGYVRDVATATGARLAEHMPYADRKRLAEARRAG